MQMAVQTRFSLSALTLGPHGSAGPRKRVSSCFSLTNHLQPEHSARRAAAKSGQGRAHFSFTTLDLEKYPPNRWEGIFLRKSDGTFLSRLS